MNKLMILAAVAAMAGAAVAESKCEIPAPQGDLEKYSGPKSRFQEKLDEIKANGKAGYDLVMVGDSITHFFETSYGKEVSQKRFAGYKVLNLGIGGDATQHVIWRFEHGQLDGYKAKVFMLMIGCNNSWDEAKDIIAGTKKIIAQIQKKHPESVIVYSPILPRWGAFPPRPAITLDQKNEEVGNAIKAMCDGKKLVYINFNKPFRDEKGAQVRKMYAPDMLHIAAPAYELWADNLMPILKKVCKK